MSTGPRWHAALVHALLGRVPDDLPEPGGVDVPRLLVDLDRCWPGGLVAVRAELAERRRVSAAGPPLPAELAQQLGPAQFAGALTELRTRLESPPTRVAVSRSLDADERRLQAEVPPHHGG